MPEDIRSRSCRGCPPRSALKSSMVTPSAPLHRRSPRRASTPATPASSVVNASRPARRSLVLPTTSRALFTSSSLPFAPPPLQSLSTTGRSARTRRTYSAPRRFSARALSLAPSRAQYQHAPSLVSALEPQTCSRHLHAAPPASIRIPPAHPASLSPLSDAVFYFLRFSVFTLFRLPSPPDALRRLFRIAQHRSLQLSPCFLTPPPQRPPLTFISHAVSLPVISSYNAF